MFKIEIASVDVTADIDVLVEELQTSPSGRAATPEDIDTSGLSHDSQLSHATNASSIISSGYPVTDQEVDLMQLELAQDELDEANTNCEYPAAHV